MVKLVVRDKETIQEAVRRFRKLVERSGIKKEMRRREYYEKPSEIKRRARLRAERRSRFPCCEDANAVIVCIADFRMRMVDFSTASLILTRLASDSAGWLPTQSSTLGGRLFFAKCSHPSLAIQALISW